MNFKDFKKVDVTKTHTVFKHHNGHTIQIAHDSLTPEQKKQMRDIPIQSAKERLREQRESMKAVKMNKGGEAEEERKKFAVESLQNLLAQKEQNSVPTVEAPEALATSEKPFMQQAGEAVRAPLGFVGERVGETLGAYKSIGKGLAEGAGQFVRGVTGAPEPVSLEEQPQAAEPAEVLENVQLEIPEEQPTVPSAPSLGAAIGMEGALQQIEGLKGISEAESAKAAAQIEAAGKAEDMLTKAAAAGQARLQKIQDSFDRLSDSYEKNTLQPERVLGTGSNKILNIAGLVLGGALQFATLGIVPNLVKKAIDDDIEKQKDEAETKNNLINANLKLFGNMIDAEKVSFMQMAQAADYIMKRAALKSADKNAMSRYLVASGELQSKLIAPYMDQLAQQAAAQQAMSQPVTSPTQIVQMIETKIPKGSRRTAIAEYSKYKQTMSDINQVKQIMQQQAELNTLANRLGSPLQTPKLLAAKKAQLFPVIKGIVGEKMTDADVRQMVDPYLVSITTSPETVNKLTDELISTIMSRAGSVTPTLELYEIDLPKPIQAKPLPTIKRK